MAGTYTDNFFGTARRQLKMFDKTAVRQYNFISSKRAKSAFLTALTGTDATNAPFKERGIRKRLKGSLLGRMRYSPASRTGEIF